MKFKRRIQDVLVRADHLHRAVDQDRRHDLGPRRVCVLRHGRRRLRHRRAAHARRRRPLEGHAEGHRHRRRRSSSRATWWHASASRSPARRASAAACRGNSIAVAEGAVIEGEIKVVSGEPPVRVPGKAPAVTALTEPGSAASAPRASASTAPIEPSCASRSSRGTRSGRRAASTLIAAPGPSARSARSAIGITGSSAAAISRVGTAQIVAAHVTRHRIALEISIEVREASCSVLTKNSVVAVSVGSGADRRSRTARGSKRPWPATTAASGAESTARYTQRPSSSARIVLCGRSTGHIATTFASAKPGRRRARRHAQREIAAERMADEKRPRRPDAPR